MTDNIPIDCPFRQDMSIDFNLKVLCFLVAVVWKLNLNRGGLSRHGGNTKDTISLHLHDPDNVIIKYLIGYNRNAQASIGKEIVNHDAQRLGYCRK